MCDYPLKFDPILKEKIWGGSKLSKVLNKPSSKDNIGESWEISDCDDDVSIVSNGIYKGKSLKNLINFKKGQLVGEKVYQKFGNNFPLLIKFIDANKPLSIQLHPNDELAQSRHQSFGKTEMWYVMQADKNADLIVGFNKKVSRETYLEHLKNKTLTHILNIEKVSQGDVFFIPTGRVHAIGAGVLLAEIQQTSDVTYRIYDWDRADSNGNYRDLHTNMALDAIDFKVKNNYKTNYTKILNQSVNIVDCPYFTTNLIELDKQLHVDHSNKDSFVIYMCVKGSGVKLISKNFNETLDFGESILIPACIKSFDIIAEDKAELLEIYIS